MSCYLYVYLKKKNVSVDQFKLGLGYLCTTPARELADEVNLEYYGGRSLCETEEEKAERQNSALYAEYKHYSVMSSEKLEEILNYYRQEIKDNEKNIERYQNELAEKKQLLISAQNKEVYECIKEDIADREEMIEWCKDSIEEITSLYNMFLWSVKSVYDENLDFDRNTQTYSSEYEIIYYLG